MDAKINKKYTKSALDRDTVAVYTTEQVIDVNTNKTLDETLDKISDALDEITKDLATPKVGIKCGDGTNMFDFLDAISIDSIYTPIIEKFEECVSNSFLSKFYNDGGIDIIITPSGENSCIVTAKTKYFSIETPIDIEEDAESGEDIVVVVGEPSNNPEYEGFVEYYNSLVAKFEDSNDVTVPSISNISTTFAIVFGPELRDIYEVFNAESLLAIIEA